MSSQIVWTLAHTASDGARRGTLGVFSTKEAAIKAAHSEIKEWPFVEVGTVVFRFGEDLGPLVGMEWRSNMGGVTQTMMVRPWEVQK